jgi:general secretion pathway protein G
MDMREQREHRARRGFTLIELLVVILILAILAALIVPRLIGRAGDAKISAAQSNLAAMGRLLETFRLDVGRYPTTEEGLQALREAPADAEGWKGPYMTRPIPLDPWNNEFMYEYPGVDGDDSYLLYSYGSDGVEGGVDEAADIIESGE